MDQNASGRERDGESRQNGNKPLFSDIFCQHENQMIMREPVYALLIQLCRAISPQYHYQMIILIQNLLAAAANTALRSVSTFGLP